MMIKKDAVLEAYVMSNKDKTFGAAAILYPEILRQVSERLGADLYILPSSTHEVILMSDNAGADAAELLKMVREVNRNSAFLEEFLADNVYHYDREEDAVTAFNYENHSGILIRSNTALRSCLLAAYIKDKNTSKFTAKVQEGEELCGA